MLLLIAFGATCIAWQLDRNRRQQIEGTWYYPTRDNAMLGYRETLTLNKDGTFEKVQRYRTFQETYSGTYVCENDGAYTFSVSTKLNPKALKDGPGFDTYQIDKRYRCRCAIDNSGYLVIMDLGHDFEERPSVREPDSCFLDWHCYSPHSHDEQSELDQQRISEFLDDL